MPKIFISYRRDDSLDATGRIHDRLSVHFGREEVFLDLHTIVPGDEFPKAIQDALQSCQLMLVIIGENRIGASFEGGRKRLDDKNDYVRREIETALDRGMLVIPVLVRWGTLPEANELPMSIRPLLNRNATTVRSDRDFHSHIDRLIRDLEKQIGPAAPRANTVSDALTKVCVVPKGLRSFDAEDAGFFLGPRPNRPESRTPRLPRCVRHVDHAPAAR